MDLLTGYGSDEGGSPSESEEPTEAVAAKISTSDTTASIADVPPSAISKPSRQENGGQQPADATAPLTIAGKLPTPRKRVKKFVQYRAPITVAPESSDEEERPKKKVKASSKGVSLTAFLPPPKHTDESSTNGLLGAGYAEAGSKRQLREDSDEEMAGPDPYRSETVLGEGNEAYRVFDQPGDVPTPGRGASGVGDYSTGYQDTASTGQDNGPVIGDQLLQQALADEQAKAAKNGLVADPFSGVQFKEISQQKLTYMPPEQREAKNATRTAFGNDYEQRIRDEAGAEPEKKAKRKHQIHSLYHQAKMKELEMMELKGQAVKTKRETQAKYGWS